MDRPLHTEPLFNQRSQEAAIEAAAEGNELLRFTLPALGMTMVNPMMTVLDNAFVGVTSSAQVQKWQ